MGRIVATVGLAVLGCALLASGQQPPPKPKPPKTDESLAKALVSRDRSARIAALDEIKQLPQMPQSLLDPVCSALRYDVEEVYTKDGAKSVPDDDKTFLSTETKIPTVPDDTTIARLRADPAAFLGDTFDLVVGLRISDDFQPSLGLVAREFQAYRLDQFSSAGLMIEGSSGLAYIPRGFGLGLAETVARNLDAGASHTLARLKCMLPSDARRSSPETQIMIVDFQTFDFKAKKWRPWGTEGIVSSVSILKRAGVPGAERLVGLLRESKMFATKDVDQFVRRSVANTLETVELDRPTKVSLAAKLRVASESFDPKSEHGPKSTEFCDLMANTFDPPRPVVDPPKDRTAELRARAATLLQSARNLEKSGKAKGAVETYRRIVKEFPAAPAAREAAKRLGELGEK